MSKSSTEFVLRLLGFLPEEDPLSVPTEASDGTWWKGPAAALVHDLIERKWHELLPTLQSGEVIRKTREELGMSVEDVATAAGVSKTLITQIELGRRRCTAATVRRIWLAMWQYDQKLKSYVSPEIIVRVNDTLEVITQYWSKDDIQGYPESTDGL